MTSETVSDLAAGTSCVEVLCCPSLGKSHVSNSLRSQMLEDNMPYSLLLILPVGAFFVLRGLIIFEETQPIESNGVKAAADKSEPAAEEEPKKEK